MKDLTLREFLEAGYALFVEEFQRYGDIIGAISKTDAAFGIQTEEERVEASSADNEKSLMQLRNQLSGVSGISL